MRPHEVFEETGKVEYEECGCCTREARWYRNPDTADSPFMLVGLKTPCARHDVEQRDTLHRMGLDDD